MKFSQITGKFFVALLLLCNSSAAFADYLWPLPFGNELTSIFGDYRTRRYHVGIDMRTGGEIGKTVVAPEDGYVMRVRTGYFGYGKVIYYKLADGNTCIFAHLSAFAPDLEEFIQQRQIASESYNQDIELSPDKFPYKRGQTIGFSGATGVGAPHLHFEFRTPDNVPVNPLTVKGFEVPDNSAPVFRNLRLIGFGNDELARALGWNFSYAFRKSPKSADYVLTVNLPCGLDDYWLSAEIVDKVGKSISNKPIYDVEVRCLDRVLYHLRYDKVPFDDTYLIDAQRNFAMAQTGNQEFYNLVNVHNARTMSGICEMVGQDPPPIEIIASDAAGNSSKAIVRIYDSTHSTKDGKFAVPKPDTIKLNNLLEKYGDIDGRHPAAFIPGGDKMYLLVKATTSKAAKVTVHSKGSESSVELNQVAGKFYLGVVDRIFGKSPGERMALRDSVYVVIEPAVGESKSFTVPTTYSRLLDDTGKFVPLISDDRRFTVEFPADTNAMLPLDDNYYYKLNRSGIGKFPNYSLEPSATALTKQVTYTYSIGDSIPKGVGLYSVGGKGLYYLGGMIDSVKKTITAKSYVLATITARQDTIPPNIRQLRPAANAVVTSARPKVSFRFSDELSGVSDNIDIRIDGKWCIPVYDPESGEVTAVSHFDLSRGKHKLEIKVADKTGNVRRMSTEFTRGGK
ncbi:MAG: M23 family metallopeptidase [bacterium]|nr:M23 family metallopeptidase [bacterium]